MLRFAPKGSGLNSAPNRLPLIFSFCSPTLISAEGRIFALLYIVAALLTMTLRLPSELPPMDEAEDRGSSSIVDGVLTETASGDTRVKRR
jgi:hypothetical protein